ncbi:hypothetical protein [Halopiger xanaduensis]|nr:hypothetical protein [Halopiger xanaduensis]
MSSARCPDRPEAAGKTVDRRLTDAGLERRFGCGNCGLEWAVTF